MVFIDFHSLLNLLCVLGCSRVLILFLFLTLFFHPIFLRDSVPPCLRGEYWVLVVAPPRCVNLWQNSSTLLLLRPLPLQRPLQSPHLLLDLLAPFLGMKENVVRIAVLPLPFVMHA